MRPILIAAVLICSTGTSSSASRFMWHELPCLPDTQGLAGPFAGVTGGALLVAGGANFPQQPPWERGTKTWYDLIYSLVGKNSEWQRAGRLPFAVGYGVSFSLPDGILCAGGNDATRHRAEVTLISRRNGLVEIQTLAPLPVTLAYAAGARVGNRIYLAGGQETPSSAASDRLFTLDLLGDPLSWRWVEKAPCPGPGRILPTAAEYAGAFFLVGGAHLARSEGAPSSRTYLNDAWRYDEDRGWTRLSDLPWPIVAAPSPAPATTRGFLILGCDDGSYSSPEQITALRERHPGFRPDILEYDVTHNQWHPVGSRSQPAIGSGNDAGWAAIVTTVVPWQNLLVLPSGEARPGVRTARVSALVDTLTAKSEQPR